MHLVSTERRLKILKNYKKEKYFFPIIGSVLSGTQEGQVLSLDKKDNAQYYVEHKFGFAQIIGNTSFTLSDNLKNYLFIEKKFKVPKVRIYNCQINDADIAPYKNTSLSERQHFNLDLRMFHDAKRNINTYDFVTQTISETNIKDLREYGIIERFWNSEKDFIDNSHAILLYEKNRLISYCYSAGNSETFCEIDVFTHEKFRRKGIAKITVLKFVETLLNKGLKPYWDCYTNNFSSMELARAIGFKPLHKKYKLLTVSK